MGLSTTHGCFEGSYGGFANFREAVAQAAGVESFPESGCVVVRGGGPDGLKHVHQLTQGNIDGKWASYPVDPIWVFLCHSDCDGSIKYDIAKEVGNRLLGLVDKINPIYVHYVRRFGDGCLTAAKARQHVRFL